MSIEKCIGCGVETDRLDGTVHQYLLSSLGCWKKFGEILAREYENPEYMLVHSLTVDAYALQHPGIENSKTISSAYVHLVSLYSYFELGIPIIELPNVKKALSPFKGRLTWLEPPLVLNQVTVADVLNADSVSQHHDSILKWSRYVYDSWEIHHSKIASLLSNDTRQ